MNQSNLRRVSHCEFNRFHHISVIVQSLASADGVPLGGRLTRLIILGDEILVDEHGAGGEACQLLQCDPRHICL